MLEKIITFESQYKDFLLKPVPIKKLVPDWYKKLSNYTDDKLNYQNPTAKKCMPLLDSFTSGYAILNPIDIVFFKGVENGEEVVHWRYPHNFDLDKYPNINIGIEVHKPNQINLGFIKENEYPVAFKILNPWIVRTPKNYSCLFVNPFNSSKERKIRTLDAIVETDSHCTQVNFPFFLKKFDENKSVVLEKGEPLILIFPYLRDNWKMKIKDVDSDIKLKKEFSLFSTIKDNYKKISWRRKSYD